MTSFNRPPRQPFPALPIEEIDIPPPPTPAPPPSNNWLVGILPVMGIGVMALFYVWRAATVRGSSALFAIPLFVLAIFAIAGTIVAGRWRIKDHERNQRRTMRNYIRTLERKRARLHAAHNARRGILETTFPAPATGLNRALLRDASLWERRPDDTDFMVMRVGVGDTPAPLLLSLPDPDSASPEIARAFKLADTYRTLHRAPITFSLLEHFATGVTGRRDLVLGAARAMLSHLSLAHAPTDLHIFIIGSRADDWHWCRWLPHVQGEPLDRTAFEPVNVRMLLGTLSQLVDMRRESAEASRLPHLLIVLDNPQLVESEAVYTTLLREGNRVGASVLCLTSYYEDVPGECTALVEIANNGGFRVSHTGDPEGISGEQTDTLPATDAEQIARGLANVSLRETGLSGRVPRRVNFLDLYGVRRVDDLQRLIEHQWARDVQDGILPHPVPIGRESLTTNTYLLLDEDHHGPHGVLAGTTGSGKSELLQTLVCSLAVEHDPRVVNFLLIDFKGGSTFRTFEKLPHTVGMVTNLDGALVERALEALRAETKYRQQFLKATNARDITQYYRYHAPTSAHLNAPGYQPLPHLFIIVDEFAQLAKDMPDFLHELVRTAQVGRSLGLHLILGTQSPMDVITEEMNANLQFRICLRVQNAEASRAMLRRPDAAYLPAGLAGRGYFMVGERGVYKQFQTAYAGSDYTGQASTSEQPLLQLLTRNGKTVNLLHDDDLPRAVTFTPDADEPQTTAAAIIDRIAGYVRDENIPYLSPLLLNPLEEQITLEDPFVMFDAGGWNGREWHAAGRTESGEVIQSGSAPVGMVDDVYNRQQYPLWVHLNTEHTRGGHLMIVGGPGSGKTTLLTTLGTSLALLHSPEQLHLYLLSLTGNGLAPLSHLPHAERVVHGTETERVRRLFSRLIKLLDERKASRSRDYAPTTVLFIDQYEQLRDTYYEQHLPDFERLIHEGRSVGIYVVFTASTASAVPDRIRSLVQQRIALRMANNADYLTTVGQVSALPDRAMPPGRGFVAGSPPLVCHVSLPTFGRGVNEDIEQGTRKIVNDMRQGAAHMGQMQAPDVITELPETLLIETLPTSLSSEAIVTTLGQVDDDDLSAFVLNWDDSGPHFIVTGPPGSGKTNLLRGAVLSAAASYPPEDIRFLLLDFAGRSLRDMAGLKHVLAHITQLEELETALAHLHSEMAGFARGDVGTGMFAPPRTVLVIDDYEIAADVMSMNLDTLRQLRDHARLHADYGLHIWAAGYMERTGDPLMKQLLLRRTGFALQERESLHNLNVRVANLPAEPMPVGRAYYAQHNAVRVVQTGLVEDSAFFVEQINGRIWQHMARARWHHPAHGTPLAGPPQQTPLANGEQGGGSLDIDTAGLIEDLFGGDGD
ncbi:MAG: FtsK/SpoIIIE domain-containing protein [Chloroflexota bacterium]